MKRIIIGRANDSDIIIPDEHDDVSRHHAVITFDFFGRMTMSDTSSNGTWINDKKMIKGTSIPITRNDKIQLGGAWVFDWNLVEDPYKSLRRSCIAISCVLLLCAIGGIAWFLHDYYHKDETPSIEIPKPIINNNVDTWNADSTNKVAPTEINIKTTDSAKQKVHSAKKKNKKSVKKTKKNATDKELTNLIHRKASDRKASEKNDSNGEMPVIN